jgi:hypothetical protein
MHLPLLVQTCARRRGYRRRRQADRDASGDRHAVGRVEPGRLDHRTGLDAFAAAGAGVDRRIDPRLHRFHEPATAVRHDAAPFCRWPQLSAANWFVQIVIFRTTRQPRRAAEPPMSRRDGENFAVSLPARPLDEI